VSRKPVTVFNVIEHRRVLLFNLSILRNLNKFQTVSLAVTCTTEWHTLLPFIFLQNGICYPLKQDVLVLFRGHVELITNSKPTEGRANTFERRVLDENIRIYEEVALKWTKLHNKKF
jgi:hypothetical protein